MVTQFCVYIYIYILRSESYVVLKLNVKVEIHKVASWTSGVDAIKTSLHNIANYITQCERRLTRSPGRVPSGHPELGPQFELKSFSRLQPLPLTAV